MATCGSASCWWVVVFIKKTKLGAGESRQWGAIHAPSPQQKLDVFEDADTGSQALRNGAEHVGVGVLVVA